MLTVGLTAPVFSILIECSPPFASRFSGRDEGEAVSAQIGAPTKGLLKSALSNKRFSQKNPEAAPINSIKYAGSTSQETLEDYSVPRPKAKASVKSKKSKTEVISQVLATAMDHPVRADAFAILLERNATVRDIALELDEPRRHVTYHVGVLEELGCVEIAETKSVRGGRVVEHTYRASDRAYFDADAWNNLDPVEQRSATIKFVQVISRDINMAVERGTFYDPSNNHISRTPMRVDREGWDQVVTYLDQMMFGLFELHEEIDKRCRETEAETFPVKVEVLQFRSPGRKLRLKPK